MKLLLIVLAALTVAVAGAVFVLQHPGYVVIAFGHWRIEVALSLVLAGLVAAFAVLYGLLRAVAGARHLPGRVRGWQERRRARRTRAALTRGLLQLAEGRWEEAERTLLRSAGNTDAPLLHYLGAARAAQLQGAGERRDRYLAAAHESMPEADVAIGLTQAELQMAARQHEQALATLTHLRALAPRHPQVLKLLTTLYVDLGEWDHFLDLLPQLRRRGVIDAERAAELERRAHAALIEDAARSGDLARLRAAWARVPRRWQRDAGLLAAYVRRLRGLGAEAEAEPLVREALRHGWSEPLVECYGTLAGPDPGRQLQYAEAWLRGHERDAALLLALGRLCLRNRLWGKARSYLEASLGAAPTAAAHWELGGLLEQLGEHEAARAQFRKGLELAVGTGPRLPGPAPAVPAPPPAGVRAAS